MATYTEYLDFDTEEDKLKQQQLYQVTELSAQTAAVVKRSAARKTGCLPLRHIVPIAAYLCRLFKKWRS